MSNYFMEVRKKPASSSIRNFDIWSKFLMLCRAEASFTLLVITILTYGKKGTRNVRGHAHD